jgi:hypothetical protein
LVPGHDGQGAEYVHLNQPPRGVEQIPGEHDVPDDLPVVLGKERKTIRRRDGLPQGIDQVGHYRALVTERLQVDILDRLFVSRKFLAKMHAYKW